MIERSCYLSKEKGGGSMTFFPIVEILEGDLTAFVPSNLVSMTDGQIFLSAQLFGEGQNLRWILAFPCRASAPRSNGRPSRRFPGLFVSSIFNIGNSCVFPSLRHRASRKT